MRIDEARVGHAEMAQEAQAYLPCDRRRGRFPVLAAFDQQRAARIIGVVEMRVVAQPASGAMALVDDNVAGNADISRELEPLALPARQCERGTRIGHRVQIEQEIGLVVARTQLAGTPELARTAWAVQHFGIPQPVEILVEAARRERIVIIEALVGGDVREHDRQRPAPRAEAAAQQPIERDRAADLVAMGQRLQRHPRTGDAGREAPHEGDAGVARRPGRKIGKRDLDRRDPLRHGGRARFGAGPSLQPASRGRASRRAAPIARANHRRRILVRAQAQPAASSSARRSMNASQRASWSRPIHSSGWCACAM